MNVVKNGNVSRKVEQNKNWFINVLSYNVNGLGGKYLHHNFFEYLENFHIFILFETHVEEKNQQKYKNRFNNFHIYWKPATRINNRGRAIGGQICGVRKDIELMGFKHKLTIRQDFNIIQCETNKKKNGNNSCISENSELVTWFRTIKGSYRKQQFT